jgi:hypothetical protein
MKDFDQQYPGIKVNEFPTETYQSKIGPIEISASRKSIAGRPSQYQRMKNCVRECINMDIYNLKGIDFIPEVFIDLGQGPCGEASLLANYLWPDCKIVGVDPNININHLRNIAGKDNIILDPHPVIGFYGNNPHQYWPEEAASEMRIQRPGNQSVEAFLTKHNIDSIDVLKIDCESAEVGILSEMKEIGILDTVRVITGEWHWEFSRQGINDLLREEFDIRWKWTNAGSAIEWRSFEEWTREGRVSSKYDWDEFYAERR